MQVMNAGSFELDTDIIMFVFYIGTQIYTKTKAHIQLFNVFTLDTNIEHDFLFYKVSHVFLSFVLSNI